MAHIGIDLGTSNTLVALVRSGEPVVELIDGQYMVPSVVYVEPDGGNAIVGREALELWADPHYDPARCFRRWKLRMGDETPLQTLPMGAGADPLPVTPSYLTTRLVEYVVRRLAKGLGEPVESVVVTVPHGWRRERPERCRATRRAAEGARLGDRAVTVRGYTISEPVAAAAYALRATSREGAGPVPPGRTVLVCDIGGGTFDVSLVRAAAPGEPIEVLDARNGEHAGDLADALLCARVCEQYNARFGTAYPTAAQEVLDGLPRAEDALLRQWFLQAQRLKQQLSDRARDAQARGDLARIRPPTERFTDAPDPAERALVVTLDLPTLERVLEPFYEQGRALLRAFLADVPRDARPYAATAVGGGSRIWGVRERILLPVLRELYADAEADAVLERVPVGGLLLDRAIALGAALIANGAVEVTERLRGDVGVVAEVPAALAERLGLGRAAQPILLTPVLARGATLPTAARGSELGVISVVDGGELLVWEVVVDEGGGAPWSQRWEVRLPTSPDAPEAPRSVDWVLEADADGVLTTRLASARGEPAVLTGRLQRGAGGDATPAVGPDGRGPARVSPQRLREAIAGADTPGPRT